VIGEPEHGHRTLALDPISSKSLEHVQPISNSRGHEVSGPFLERHQLAIHDDELRIFRTVRIGNEWA
jgi:hypothetical protein